MSAVLKIFFGATQKLEQNCLFDVERSLDRRGNRFAKDFENILFFGEFTNGFQISLGHDGPLFLGNERLDASCDEVASDGAVHGVGVSSVDAAHLNTVTRLAAVDEVVLEDDLNAAGQLTSWRIFRHLLNGDRLEVLEHAVAELSGKGVAVVVLGHEAIAFVDVGVGRQVVLVVVVLHVSLLGLLAVVDTGRERRRDDAHLGDDTLHLHVPVQEVGFKCPRGHIVLADVSLKIDVVVSNLGRELGVRLSLLRLACIVLGEGADLVVELLLEHLDGIDGAAGNEGGKLGTKLAHLVDVDVEAFALANQVLDSLLHLALAQELVHLLTQRILLSISALLVVASLSGDVCVDLLVHLVLIV